MSTFLMQDTIIALSTPTGQSALAVIRITGNKAIDISDLIFTGKKPLNTSPGYSLHYGTLKDGSQTIDEVMLSLFRGPHSFTGEDTVEISCHGSNYITKRILELFIDKGVRLAKPGEFTQRAFLNGKLDLSQAEAVADLIASGNATAHKLALKQLKGAVSSEIADLREQLLRFAALIELELDFSTEDVEFADRSELIALIQTIQERINPLIASFKIGNAVKEGYPVAIIGMPNVGKSTLLNTLLQEEKAIVTDIAGTTRDIIEDEMLIRGMSFRFIDTAGIRETNDVVESIGIERSRQAIRNAALVLFVYDGSEKTEDFNRLMDELNLGDKRWLAVHNKSDLNNSNILDKEIKISAKQQHGIELLKDKIWEAAGGEKLDSNDVMLTNHRHYEALISTNNALDLVLKGLEEGISGELLALDIRIALDHLGSITGEISSDEVLGAIFSKFCIGK
ncbi:MAG: tRNA uridine-5-carboxymethylaminomethyl(34) synthesis GTPase MnmE [Flavobacteriales bacterium]